MKWLMRLLFLSILITPFIHAWKSAEAKGEKPIFFGTLTTREDNSFNVTNVTIGRSRDGDEKIVLYEKPKNLMPSEKGNIITVNPSEDLTTTTLELQKISKIAVPEPSTIWTWTKDESKRSMKIVYEFIELAVTWRSGSVSNYLLELGPADTQRPVKIFCDVIDKQITGIRQNGTLFCPGITKMDVRKKGAPFQSIKMLTLEEPCYKIPDNAATIKKNSDDE
jgi:hypothetical protein